MHSWIFRGLCLTLLLLARNIEPCQAGTLFQNTFTPQPSVDFSYNIDLTNYIDGDYYVSVTATNVAGKTTTKTIPLTVCRTSVQSFDAANNRTFGGSIQNALAAQGKILMMRGVEFTGNVEINSDTEMHGGYNCGYTSVTGATTIIGSLLILNGNLTIDSVVIK